MMAMKFAIADLEFILIHAFNFSHRQFITPTESLLHAIHGRLVRLMNPHQSFRIANFPNKCQTQPQRAHILHQSRASFFFLP